MTLRVFVRALVIAIAFFAAGPVAHAKMMQHTDLTSLALESEAIVRVKKTGERALDPSTKIIDHRVIESYKGPLAPGQNVETTYGGYDSFTLRGDDERYLFLRRDVRSPTADDSRRAEWWLVGSGLRVVVDGKVQRFAQQDNPGPYRPLPQARDPFDILRDPRAGDPLDVREFEGELRRAITRADAIAAALALPRGPAKSSKLVALVGSPASDEDAPVAMGSTLLYENIAATRIIEALGADRDLSATLDALSRAEGVDARLIHPTIAPAALIAAARDGHLALPFRLAAIRLLGSFWTNAKLDAAIESTVLSLFDDPQPDIRIGAIRVATGLVSNRGAAIERRWKVETDDAVRHALLLGAESELAKDVHLDRGPAPIVYAKRTRRRVDVTWVDSEPRDPLVLREALLEAKGNGSTHRIDLGRAGESWRGLAESGIHGFLPSPPLANGRWTFDVSVVLEDPRTKQIIARRFALAPMILGGPAGIEGATTVTATSVTATSPKPRSCACDLASSSNTDGGVAGLVLALLCLRRRRSAAHSRRQ